MSTKVVPRTGLSRIRPARYLAWINNAYLCGGPPSTTGTIDAWPSVDCACTAQRVEPVDGPAGGRSDILLPGTSLQISLEYRLALRPGDW